MDDDETELTPIPQEDDTQLTPVAGFEATEVAIARALPRGPSWRPDTDTDSFDLARGSHHELARQDLRALETLPECNGNYKKSLQEGVGHDPTCFEALQDCSGDYSSRAGTETGVVVVSRRLPTEADWPPSPREPASRLPPERRAKIFSAVPDDDLIAQSRSPDDGS